MLFIVGFLSAIVMICIFSLIVHSLRWIQDTFQGTIIAIHAVEVDTDERSSSHEIRSDYSAAKDTIEASRQCSNIYFPFAEAYGNAYGGKSKTPLQESLNNLEVEADKLRKTVRQFEDFEKSIDK
jgi:hypothetical protein